MSALKSSIKKLLVAKEHKRYSKELTEKRTDYNKWIFDEETTFKLNNTISRINQKILTNDLRNLIFENFENENDAELANFDDLCKLFEISDENLKENEKPQYLVCQIDILPQVVIALINNTLSVNGVIIQNYDGKLNDFSISEIHRTFKAEKNLILIYGDEDVINDDGTRIKPWFKPDWAPEDFLSYPYFGALIALRGEAIKKLNPEKLGTVEGLYAELQGLLFKEGAFAKHSGSGGKPVGHIPRILFHSFKEGYGFAKDIYPSEESCGEAFPVSFDNELVSVIIPSKDHPDILRTCIMSLTGKTELAPEIKYEIIVVDNGSDENNRALITKLLEDVDKLSGGNFSGCRYIYEKREFNFSYMCNRGVKEARGRYLLFLNDDIEITEGSWLMKLLKKAALPYAGAVGCKLLYPDSTKIQHAGITNLRIGPAHKLQFTDDTSDHYYGRNRYVHDMIGVTGACLMVRREVFDEVGGYNEALAVAFNDVELCFKLYEAGYYNIERNDVFLYHHESLSRGDDAADSEKQLRLQREKDYLYEKHPGLYGRDPFYNINLTTDMLETEYASKFHYQVDLSVNWACVKDITDVIGNARFDKCVRIGMESAMDIFKWKHGVPKEKYDTEVLNEDLGFYFQGYTFVIGADNACYERMLFLENKETKRVYGLETVKVMRPDIAMNIPDQLNVDLAGYTVKLKSGAVPHGEYQFGMYMKDRTSKQRLFNYSNWTITI